MLAGIALMSMRSALSALPFLTLPDPLISGEGALDPLGLAMIAERLAEDILPGLRARMARPRFVTAIAVAAAVCDGLQDQYASDGVTPAHIVFEWLAIEAFVRVGDHGATLGTPGIQKGREARSRNDAMCARTYLKTPSVFGFHGVYKPLAQHLGIVDDELRLADRGYELLKVWQWEQGLDGFLDSTNVNGPGRLARQTLRSALDAGLAASCTQRGNGWQGWELLANHLAPARIGQHEARLIRRLLTDPDSASRGEIFDLLFEAPGRRERSEEEVTDSTLMPGAKAELSARLNAISAYEKVCASLEETFDWIRYLSTHSVGRPITVAQFGQAERVRRIAKDLGENLHCAESAMAISPLPIQQLFSWLVKSFSGVRDAGTLFEAILARHAQVQADKPPTGTKRSWFERAPEGATFVRPPYRLHEPPKSERGWNRPYRIHAAVSFVSDLEIAHA